jgi:hypothetical protein
MSWTVTAQLTSGTQTVGATDRLWFNGIGGTFGTDVIIGSYQDGTHISNNTDVHLCTTNHVHNTKYLTSTTMSLDGAGSANLSSLSTGNAPFKFTFDTTDIGGASVSVSGGKLYVFSGSDGTPATGVTVQAAQAGVSTSWANIGSGTASSGLSLADQASATTHNFFIALSVSPTSTGSKTTNSIKLSLTYV